MVYRSLSFLPSKVPLNGAERYRKVFNGIEWYLNGIPLADFDEIVIIKNIIKTQ